MTPRIALVPALLIGLAACTAAPAVRPGVPAGDLDDVTGEGEAPDELSVDVFDPLPGDGTGEGPPTGDDEPTDEPAEDGRVEWERVCFRTPPPRPGGVPISVQDSRLRKPCGVPIGSAPYWGSICVGGSMPVECGGGAAYAQYYSVGRECEPEPICCADTGIGEPVSGPEAARPAPRPRTPCAYYRDGIDYYCGKDETEGRCVTDTPDTRWHGCMNGADRWVWDFAWKGPPCTDDAECAAAAAANCPPCPEGGARAFCAGGVCRRVCGVTDGTPTKVKHSCGNPAYRTRVRDGRTFTCWDGEPVGEDDTFEGPPCFTHGDCDTIIGAGCNVRAWDAPWPQLTDANWFQAHCRWRPCEGDYDSGLGDHGVWRFRCRNYACRAECAHPYAAATESLP